MSDHQQQWAEQLKKHRQQAGIATDERSMEELNDDIGIQLDRIYQLLDEGKNASFIKVEFKRYVELMTEKASMQLQQIKRQPDIPEKERTAEEQRIQREYVESLQSIAQGIDETLGLT